MEFLPRIRSIGVTINKHSSTVLMDIDDIDQPVEQHTSILEGIESRNTDWTPPSPTIAEEFLPIVEKKRPIHRKGTR